MYSNFRAILVAYESACVNKSRPNSNMSNAVFFFPVATLDQSKTKSVFDRPVLEDYTS